MSLDALPNEIHKIILTHLTSNDLVSLSRTTRNFNFIAVPILYQHTLLDFSLGDEDSSTADDNDIALSALLGLVADTQGQCRHVKRLSVRSREEQNEASGAQEEGFSNDHDETKSAITSLLEAALQNMSHISHLDWYSIFSTPEAVFAALKAPLESLHCSAAWLDKSPNIDFDGTAALKSLISLSTVDMAEGEMPPLLLTMLSQHLVHLKSLKLQYLRPTDGSHTTSECPFETLAKDLNSAGKHINLTILSLSFPRAPTSTTWLKSLISPSLMDFTYHMHAPNGERTDLAGDQMHNELFAYLHAHTQNQGIELKALQTNTFPPSLTSLIESSRSLETLILTYQPPSFCGDAINLSGHFRSLRSLCLPHADRIFYDDDVIRLYSTDSFGYLQVIIDNCPLLEELAMNVCAGQEESLFETLRAAPALKRLFILLYRDSPWDLQLPAGHLLREMLSYYNGNPSPFFERLELFGCFRSLWTFEHTMDLTPEEVEEMEYELGYETVSDDELADLGIAVERRDLGISSPGSKREDARKDQGEGEGEGEDEDDEDVDMGFDLFDAIEPPPRPPPSQPKNEYTYPSRFTPAPLVPVLRDTDAHIIMPWHLLDEPFCYTWERAISGYYKVPLRVGWDDARFLDERMVEAVRGIVERYQWADPANTRGLEDEWRRATTQTRRWG